MQSTMNPLSTLVAACLMSLTTPSGRCEDMEAEARNYLRKVNEEMLELNHRETLASYRYETNMTSETLARMEEVAANNSVRFAEIRKQTVRFKWREFRDPDARRQFRLLWMLVDSDLPEEKDDELGSLISEMTEIYVTARICEYGNRTRCDLRLEPDIVGMVARSRDPEELRYAWTEWRSATGPECRGKWERYVALSNEAARLADAKNTAEVWLSGYEQRSVAKLWHRIRPLYLELHAYVRRRLRERYGEAWVSPRAPIPAHLLGNVWAQEWIGVRDFTEPFPDASSTNLTDQMIRQGYTPVKMFRSAENFYLSLGLDPFPATFWNESLFTNPKDGRELLCHPTAYDMSYANDFRIKMCTEVNFEDFQTVYHETGHVQYFMQYKDQPFVYREGANDGFHEAIGEVMALSATSRNHLRLIGLLPPRNVTGADRHEETINFLYGQALARLAFMPYALLVDAYRWAVFKGDTPPSRYNCDYWRLREEIQGVEPPVDRSEQDFDPAAKYHLVADVPYVRYFVSGVLQFQIYRALCIKAKKFDPKRPADKPLHECNIYGSKEAGDALKSTMRMGSSKPWPDALYELVDQRAMDASGLLEYFKPLHDWLKRDNRDHGEFVGWEPTTRRCTTKRDAS